MAETGTSKWTEDLNGQFSKDIGMAKKHMKRCSAPLVIRETHIKTTVNYHFLPLRGALLKGER